MIKVLISLLRIIRFHFLHKVSSNLTFNGNIISVQRKYPDKLNIFLRAGSSDIDVYYQIFIHDEYSGLINYIRKNSNTSSIHTIIDAGANIGLTTCYLMHFLPHANIVSIEPDELNFKMLNMNVEANFSNGIHLVNAALWNSNTEHLQLNSSFRDGKDWSKSIEEVIDTTSKKTVKGLTVIDIAKQYNFDTIDILKIDIEGAERFVFENEQTANEFLRITRFLVIEIHDEFDIRDKIYQILHACNFSFYRTEELTIGHNNSFIKND